MLGSSMISMYRSFWGFCDLMQFKAFLLGICYVVFCNYSILFINLIGCLFKLWFPFISKETSCLTAFWFFFSENLCFSSSTDTHDSTWSWNCKFPKCCLFLFSTSLISIYLLEIPSRCWIDREVQSNIAWKEKM